VLCRAVLPCRDGCQTSSTSGSGAHNNNSSSSSSGVSGSNASYLQQKLVYSPEGDKLLDADGELGNSTAQHSTYHSTTRDMAQHSAAQDTQDSHICVLDTFTSAEQKTTSTSKAQHTTHSEGNACCSGDTV